VGGLLFSTLFPAGRQSQLPSGDIQPWREGWLLLSKEISPLTCLEMFLIPRNSVPMQTHAFFVQRFFGVLL